MADSMASSLPNYLDGNWERIFKTKESFLALATCVIFAINAWSSPFFLDAWNLSDATFNFTEKAMIAFVMAMLIITGEIDLSVASIIALTSTAMGFAAQYGADTALLVVIGLIVGLMCGLLNGLLVSYLGLSSIVVTIGSMSLFRGISYVVLQDQAYTQYPESFSFFGQGYVFWVISFEFVLFLGFAICYGVILHRTTFGRALYAIGNNPTASLFSGIRVNRVKLILFLLTGLMSGIASICLTSRLGSTRPTIAFGWELEIVVMVVLGGVNILGGSGSILGVVLASLMIGMVTFGFGLLNIPGIVMSVFIGILLIAIVALPHLTQKLFRKNQ